MRRASLAAALACVTVLAAFTVAILPAFAGTGEADPTTPLEGDVGAARAVADPLAKAWNPEAYLAKAFASEGPQRSAMEDPPFLYDTSGDPDVGNGRAPVWTLAYAAPGEAGRLFFVAVLADGRVDYAGELPDPEHGCCYAVAVAEGDPAVHSSEEPAPHPVAFTIDASDAFAAVADRPEFRNFSREHPVHSATSRLANGHDGNSTWWVSLHTATHFGAFAAVDASNGTVLHTDAWPRNDVNSNPMPPTPPDPEPWAPEDYHAEHAGSLSMAQPWFEVRIPVEYPAYAEELAATVRLDGALPGEAFTLRLYDDNGAEVARASVTDEANVTLTEFTGWGGLYRLELHPDGVVLHDVDVAVTVDIDYGDAPRETEPPTGPFVHTSEVGPLFGEAWFEVDPHGGPVERVVATLTWNRTLATQNLEVVFLDAYGNPVAEAQGEDVETGTSTITLEAATLGEWCCAMVVVRSAQASPLAVPFTLTLEPEYAEDGRWH